MERKESLMSYERLKRMMSTKPSSDLTLLKGKSRFRAVVRMVLANLQWLADDADGELGDDVRRNVILLKRRRTPQTTLSLAEKSLLKKPANLRSSEEKMLLCRIFKSIKCFKQFPEDVQKKLAAYMYFEYYGPNRVIVRQGHEAYAIYFIMHGEVAITVTEYDTFSESMVTTAVGTMGVGDKFGDVSLLYNIPRTATVTTLTVCEMLLLKKEDFAHVLQQTLQMQWDLCKSAMARFPYFDDWSETKIREGCILSRMRSFSPGDTIYGDGKGKPTYTYFVLSGQCKVVEVIKVQVQTVGEKLVFRQVRDPPEGKDPVPLSPGHRIETHFMQVCLLNTLACFGIGEQLYGRRIIAVSSVECLLMPSYLLLQHDHCGLWERIRRFLERCTPTPRQVFREFVEQRQWLSYRQKLVAHVRSQRRAVSSGTSEHDVPLSIRLRESYHYFRYRGYIHAKFEDWDMCQL